jgi:hypothetical protein
MTGGGARGSLPADAGSRERLGGQRRSNAQAREEAVQMP